MDESDFPHPLPWPHEPVEIVKEAVREYMGDGDGMDFLVLAEYNEQISRQALTEAIKAIHKEGHEPDAEGRWHTPTHIKGLNLAARIVANLRDDGGH